MSYQPSPMPAYDDSPATRVRKRMARRGYGSSAAMFAIWPLSLFSTVLWAVVFAALIVFFIWSQIYGFRSHRRTLDACAARHRRELSEWSAREDAAMTAHYRGRSAWR